MTERVKRTARRDKRAEAPRESIEELFGDIIADKPSGLYDEDDVRAPAASPGTKFKLQGDLGGGAGDGGGGGGAYHDSSEGAPGGFARRGKFEYAKKGGDLDGIVVRHGALTILTMGLWRFWQKTAVRRSVWAHTRLGGEPFEYTGKGWELALGALIGIGFVGTMAAIIGMTFAMLGITVGVSESLLRDPAARALLVAALVGLPLLIEYARFRARRYRLRRTVWRSLRFDMEGSGVGLALRWLLYAPLSAVTLGLANPFLRMQRERYMTERTCWGKEKFHFSRSAWRLMPSWTLFWFWAATPALVMAAVIWHAAEAERVLPQIGDAAAVEEARAAAYDAYETALAGAPGAAIGTQGAGAAAEEPAPPEPEIPDAPAPIVAPPPAMMGGGMLEPGERAAPPPGLALPPPVHPIAKPGAQAGQETGEEAAAQAGEETGAETGEASGEEAAAEEPPAAEPPALEIPEQGWPAAYEAWAAAPEGVKAPLRALAALRTAIVGVAEGFAEQDAATQAVSALVWMLGALLLFLSYRAAEIRSFVEGRRLLGARATCTFGPDDILASWLAVVGRSIWPGIPISIGIGIVTLIPIFSIDGETLIQGADTATMEEMVMRMEDWRDQGLIILALLLSYGMTALLMMWLTMAVLFRAYHTRLCRSITVEGMESLDRARQRSRAKSMEAEGLADALDIDIGF